MNDENYKKIVDSVGKLQQGKEEVVHGTALMLFSNAFESDLNSSIKIYPMRPTPLKVGEKEGLVLLCCHFPSKFQLLLIRTKLTSVLSKIGDFFRLSSNVLFEQHKPSSRCRI